MTMDVSRKRSRKNIKADLQNYYGTPPAVGSAITDTLISAVLPAPIAALVNPVDIPKPTKSVDKPKSVDSKSVDVPKPVKSVDKPVDIPKLVKSVDKAVGTSNSVDNSKPLDKSVAPGDTIFYL